MDRKLIFFLCAAILLAGCTRPIGGDCINDNYCSQSELLRGGCPDCMPDFLVGEVDVHYYDGKAVLFYCIENVNGEYEGPLDVWRAVGGIAHEYHSGDPIENVYFKSPVAESHAFVTNNDGVLDVSFNFQSGDKTEVWCESVEIPSEPSRSYWVNIGVDPENKIEEKNEENNKASEFIITGVEEHYPNILWEETLWPYEYEYSDLTQWGRGIQYTARYSSDEHGTFASVTRFPSREILLEDTEWIYDDAERMYVNVYVDEYEMVEITRVAAAAEDASFGGGGGTIRPARSRQYYAEILYKIAGENEHGDKFVDVHWQSKADLVSMVIFVPEGRDVEQYLDYQTMITAYTSRYLPDGATPVPRGCPRLETRVLNDENAIQFCEEQGGTMRIHTVDINERSCEVVDCVKEPPYYLSGAPEYVIVDLDLDYWHEGNGGALGFEIEYYDHETEEELEAEIGVFRDRDALLELVRLENFEGRFDATLGVIFETFGAFWTHENIFVFFEIETYGGRLDEFRQLLDFEAYSNEVRADLTSDPLFEAYLDYYQSDLNVNSTCPFSDYPRSFAYDCIRYGGTLGTTTGADSCLWPTCTLTDAQGAACTDILPTGDCDTWYTVAFTDGCPRVVCRPEVCPGHEPYLWEECSEQNQDVLVRIRQDGCEEHYCGTCDNTWDPEAYNDCRNAGGLYAYRDDGSGCSVAACVQLPEI